MIVAPLSYDVCKRRCKSLGNVIMIAVSCNRYLTIRKIPQKLGQMLYQRIAVSGDKGLFKVVRPRQLNSLFAFSEGECRLAYKLWLIGED